MLAIQSDIAKYHCLYTQGAVAFQMPGVFFLTYPVLYYIISYYIICIMQLRVRTHTHAMERMRLNGWIILYWVAFHVVLDGLASYIGGLSSYTGRVIILNAANNLVLSGLSSYTGWVIILSEADNPFRMITHPVRMITHPVRMITHHLV